MKQTSQWFKMKMKFSCLDTSAILVCLHLPCRYLEKLRNNAFTPHLYNCLYSHFFAVVQKGDKIAWGPGTNMPVARRANIMKVFVCSHRDQKQECYIGEQIVLAGCGQSPKSQCFKLAAWTIMLAIFSKVRINEILEPRNNLISCFLWILRNSFKHWLISVAFIFQFWERPIYICTKIMSLWYCQWCINYFIS